MIRIYEQKKHLLQMLFSIATANKNKVTNNKKMPPIGEAARP